MLSVSALGGHGLWLSDDREHLGRSRSLGKAEPHEELSNESDECDWDECVHFSKPSCTFPNLALVCELAMLTAIETEYLFLFTDSEADGNVDHFE